MGKEAVNYCVDSDILIDYTRGREAAKAFLKEQVDRAPVYISVVSVAELASGTEMRNDRKRREVMNFLGSFHIIPLDTGIAIFAGELRRDLGRPLIDMTIAATACEYHLTLATRNEKHFRGIDLLDTHKPY